ncbi:MAG: EamA family transporter [Thermoleophilia bacterium]|nr:EamA family transporter [Thermoleophilia bacterium]
MTRDTGQHEVGGISFVSPPSRPQIIAAFFAVYVLWGMTFLGTRYAIETLPPLLMVSVRSMIAGGVLYAWARLRGASRPSADQWKVAFIAGAFLILMAQGGVAWGQQTVPSGVAAVLVSTIPMWILVLEWFRPSGRRPSVAVSVGLLLGFSGVLLLVSPWESGARGISLLGAAVVLFAALAWAVGSLYTRSAEKPVSHPQAAGMQLLAGGVLLLVPAIAGGDLGAVSPGNVSITSLLAFLYLVVFSSVVAFSAYMWLLGVCRATWVATYAYVNPVVAVGVGWAVAGEPLTGRMVLAMVVAIGAVALVTTRTTSGGYLPPPAMASPCCLETAETGKQRPVEPEHLVPQAVGTNPKRLGADRDHVCVRPPSE